ncbi:VanZ family protein [Microbacterium dauci]|uniref:VanZ family protein n=1 Tax=Microbacterium dauci TaxID=3048008 RepID=A0ABT6ZBI0_9MICO|nr:VanZ family protein [Microbacterium sp. LX3-4]MDJ1113356.1 VanZ family protein [Microbacterium sp. LX3-4]
MTRDDTGLRVHRAAARVVLAILTALYAWAVAWMTLRAAPYGSDIQSGLNRLLAWFAQRDATRWITFERVEFGANIAMFVPLGVIAVLWFGVRGWWLAPILGAAASATIEALQAMLLDTRVADLRDIVSNTIGSVIGMCLMLLLAFLLSPPSPKR